jgi:hypothetical protein
MEPADVAAIVLSLFALGVSIYGVVTARTANAYARDANTISQKIFEAENLPKLSVSLSRSLVTLDADKETGALTPVLVAVVKNEGRIPVTIKHAYIAKHGKQESYGYGIVPEYEDLSRTHPFPKLPYNLEGWNQVEIPATGDTIAQMLHGLRARPEDLVVIRVIDAIGRKYETETFKAGEYMEKRRFSMTRVNSEEESMTNTPLDA